MTVQSFETGAEMLKELQEQGKKAQESAKRLDVFLKEFREPGTCFVQIHPYGFLIYGIVEKIEGEDEEDQEMLEESFLSGYIFCRAFSSVCPRGELGSIHASRISAIISKEGFEWARENGWPETLTRELQEAVTVTNTEYSHGIIENGKVVDEIK